MEHALCPAQEHALDQMTVALADSAVVILSGNPGMGKTTLLRVLHDRLGGALLTNHDVIAALRPHHPLTVEETFEELVAGALAAHDHVIVDDLNLVTDVVNGCGSYPRSGLLNGPLTTLATRAAE